MRPPMPLRELLLRLRATACGRVAMAARARACARARGRAIRAEAEVGSRAVVSCAEARARAAHAYVLRAQRQAGASAAAAGRRLCQATDSAGSTLLRVAYGESPPKLPSSRELLKMVEQRLLGIHSLISTVNKLNNLNSLSEFFTSYSLTYILAVLLAPVAVYYKTFILSPVSTFYENVRPTAPETFCPFLGIRSVECDEFSAEEGLSAVVLLCTSSGGAVLLSAGGLVLCLCVDIGTLDSMSEWGTPLDVAAQCNVEMMESLLKYKANPTGVVQQFYAPLTSPLYASSLKCVELLIKAGADVNAGRPVTPFELAAMDGLTDCIKFLLEAQADPNIPDECDRMPVEIAAIHGWKGHHKSEEPALKALGDAAFERKDYAHASALYTKAMETDPKDPSLYAKRILCWLHMGEKDKALDDANTCGRMGLDEEGVALLLSEDYGQACEALISSVKLDSGSGPVGEVSREKDK